jgi:predicted transcriptional regulator
MVESDVEVMKKFRARIGISQKRAGLIFGCSREMIAHIEIGRAKLGWQRRKRIQEADEAFTAGGLEAVQALPAFTNRRILRTIPVTDREDLRRWRRTMGLSRQGAARQLGFGSVHMIDAIEAGRRRITETIRDCMVKDEKKGSVEEP